MHPLNIMKGLIALIAFSLFSFGLRAGERQMLWPEENGDAYIEWYEAPAEDVRTGGCVILISGVSSHMETFTRLGFQCVNLICQDSWQSGQRAVRMARQQAEVRGFDPEKIGVVSMSTGSSLGLLLATASRDVAYEGTDTIDDISPHINWAIINTTGRQCEVYHVDDRTCPVSLHHGGFDQKSSSKTIQVYRKLRQNGIPAELHLYLDYGYESVFLERGLEFLKQLGYMGPLEGEEELMNRYADDGCRAIHIVQNIWPEGMIPDFNEHQCIPYLEWHIPDTLKTTAIQIIYSGGSYQENNPDGFEVTPMRRYLNEKGMAVVTLKYRTPRPVGMQKHITAWQDLQRTIKLVRSQAAEKGLDPDRVGIMGSSAGGHLTLMGVTSSCSQSYLEIDDVDRLSCKVQWGVGIYPAYVLTDGVDGSNSDFGNLDENIIVPEFAFDQDTAPMIFIHGDADGYSAMGSVWVWEKMASMGVQSELHTLVHESHCFQYNAFPGTGSYTHMERVWEFLCAKGFAR